MSKYPIYVESRAWTGEVAGQPQRQNPESIKALHKSREARRIAYLLLLLLGGGLLCTMADFSVWLAEGASSFIAPARSVNDLLGGVGVAFVALVAVFSAGLRRLWPVAIMAGVVAVSIAGNLRYLQDANSHATVRIETFAIAKIELKRRGRGPDWTKWRPTVDLIDRQGRYWKMEGSRHAISPLVGHDCITVVLRGAPGQYMFVDGPPRQLSALTRDWPTGRRHLARCFTADLSH